MSNGWIMRTWELLDTMDFFRDGPIRIKPMNTRTRKTVWKERRRRAKPAEGDSKRTTTSSPAEGGAKVTRRKMADGTTIERRGNCQGGNAS